MADIFNYVPDDVSVLIAGLLTADGFVDGTFVNIDKDDMPYRSRTTADGRTSRLYRRSQTYTVSLTFHQGSIANDFLTKLWELDEVTGKAKFTMLVKDRSGSDLFFASTCWIEGLPSLVKSNGIDSKTWRIKCSFATINFGNNKEQSTIVQDLVNIATSSLPALNGII